MLVGIGVSPGIGFAHAMAWQAPVSHDYVPKKSGNPEVETKRLDAALKGILEKNRDLKEKTVRHLGKSEAVIFDAYELILSDEESLIGPTKEKICVRSLSAEYAVLLQFGELARRFLEMENDYMRQRAEDIFGLRDQLLREMLGVPTAEANHLDRPTIVVANALTPADIANLDLSRLEGIICELGGYSSHMSIIARTLGIPAVVGIKGALECIGIGDMIALDGESGEVWTKPNESDIRMLRKRSDRMIAKKETAQLYRGMPTITADGRRIELAANVGQLEELDTALEADAEAIGMYRTELLHLQYKPLPTEDQQFEVYRTALERAAGKAVTVRTFDDGGNTPVLEIKNRDENNPVLGFRGIRMSLGRQSFFRTQLRALLRASAYGNLKVVFPMVSSLDELMEAKKAIENVKSELLRENIPFDEKMPVGILISVPSSALLSDVLANHVNFFSISINDLIQFTLAVDRGTTDMAYLYQQYHPAVLRLIKLTVDAAHNAGIPCNLSGEVPGQNKLLPLMLGLGLDGFSVNPGIILSTRQMLSSCNYEECRLVADEMLRENSAIHVAKKLEHFNFAHSDAVKTL